jgi:hypothetical protein
MEFKTTDMPFAAYLQTKSLLKFLRIDPNPEWPHKAEIVFSDPDDRGRQLEIDFLSGAEVPAIAFQATLKTIRRSIELAKAASSKTAIQSKAVRRG